MEEQAHVLKEEIRRHERNAERLESAQNLEYLKNVSGYMQDSATAFFDRYDRLYHWPCTLTVRIIFIPTPRWY